MANNLQTTGSISVVKMLKCKCPIGKSKWVLAMEAVEMGGYHLISGTGKPTATIHSGGRLTVVCKKCKTQHTIKYNDRHQRAEIIKANNIK